MATTAIQFYTPRERPFSGLASFFRLRSQDAALAAQRLALAATTGQPCVLTAGELLAWLAQFSMDATAIRNFDGKHFRLPIYALDRASEIALASEAPGSAVSPFDGAGAIACDVYGPTLGYSDERSAELLIASRGVLEIAKKAKRTSALLTGAGLPTLPPIESGGGDKLGIAPAIAAIIAGGVVVGVVGVAWVLDKGSTERLVVEKSSAVVMHGVSTAHKETLARWQIRAEKGIDLAPSPLEIGAGAAVKAAADQGRSSGWMGFALGVGASLVAGVGGNLLLGGKAA